MSNPNDYICIDCGETGCSPYGCDLEIMDLDDWDGSELDENIDDYGDRFQDVYDTYMNEY